VHLPEKLRSQLRKPLGLLIKDSETTKENILSKIPQDAFVITVGDATTEKMIKFGLNPQLQVVDSLEKRSKRDLPLGECKTVLTCSNPAGQISEQSISVIRNALDMPKPARIIVTGEEDLLVLPVSLHAPDNSVILYGQPNEGLVIIRLNDEIRNKVKLIMASMN